MVESGVTEDGKTLPGPATYERNVFNNRVQKESEM